LARLSTFAASVWEIYQFIPLPPPVVYRDEFIIARFQHCLGGAGVPIPVMSLLIVSKIACQRIFMLSDSGVPRTFVVDCNPRQKSWYACPLLQHLSGKFISSSPSPRFNVAYRDEFTIARFQHCLGGGGFLI